MRFKIHGRYTGIALLVVVAFWPILTQAWPLSLTSFNQRNLAGKVRNVSQSLSSYRDSKNDLYEFQHNQNVQQIHKHPTIRLRHDAPLECFTGNFIHLCNIQMMLERKQAKISCRYSLVDEELKKQKNREVFTGIGSIEYRIGKTKKARQVSINRSNSLWEYVHSRRKDIFWMTAEGKRYRKLIDCNFFKINNENNQLNELYSEEDNKALTVKAYQDLKQQRAELQVKLANVKNRQQKEIAQIKASLKN
jgi:hypothetical protein